MITLESPRILDDKIIEQQVKWLNDKSLMRYSEQRHVTHTFDSQIKYIKDFLHHPDNILREIHIDGVMAGTITAYIDMKNRIADMGILIGSGYGHNGIGHTAWAMLGDILFEKLNLRRIEAGCMALNIPMLKIMKRYHMAEEGRRMSHFMVDGTYSDLVLYGRFR